MLTNTFTHIQGIGLKTEADLWNSGIKSWDDFRLAGTDLVSPTRASYINQALDEAAGHLPDRPDYFTGLLPASQHWRIFPHFQNKTAYLDIETTGLSDSCEITTIALYDGKQIRYYVQGENLDSFPADIMNYDVLVSYNGKTFDVPVINRYFNIQLSQAHIDLRYVLNNLGIKGGLKGCERQLGLDRGDLDGVDGYMAVILWNHYRQTGDRNALETLLAYNIMDTINLEQLMIEAYNRNLSRTPFREKLLPEAIPPEIPFSPDRKLIAELSAMLRNYPAYH
ncbi:MAG: ribonuclease H-like domain-containing protein [Thermodesulfobacteriota bacterium]